MIKPRFSCLDIILFSAFAYAISDSVKNWDQYMSCNIPIQLYITVSCVTLLLFRLFHFLGHALSGGLDAEPPQQQQQPQPPMPTFAWDKIGRLRMLSYFQLLILVPFFLAWTIYGTVLFVKISSGEASCAETGSNDTFAFLIFWFILSYILIFCYICLLLYGVSSAQRSARVKKSMLQLLRKLNASEMSETNQEIYENALLNI